VSFDSRIILKWSLGKCINEQIGLVTVGISRGNKYRNLALHVGGVSKIQTIKCAHESRGTQI
jgi:hypothetical protein